LSPTNRRNTSFGPSRSRGTVVVVAALWLAAGAGTAFAQANPIEERGLTERASEPAAVDDRAFDCAAFKQAIAYAADGFKALRGETKRDDESIAQYGVTSPLFGSCDILDKKKVGEISLSCQADKLSLADIKATVEACLGAQAFGNASNENPNTPYLRYDPQIGAARARVIVLATFGKKTLAIFNPR
jgi:hypothetical protein